MNQYLSNLNEQQRKAVEYIDGPSLVIAGAGSGKTRVLTYKIVHLLEMGYDPHRILALTFTNKAAREMEDRISRATDIETASRIWMGTFHSIFLKLLRYNHEKIGFKRDFTIYDTSDSRSLVKLIIKEMELDDKVYKASSIHAQISNIKNSLISPERYESDSECRKADERAKRPLFYRIYNAYWNRCKIANAMDFDDILFYTNILLRDNPDVLEKYQDYFQFVLVDEYQDTNFAQHLIISQLCKKHNKLCVVGDDAQSIYSFRGANIHNILNLKNQFKDLKIFKLEQNYRSTQNIINAANTLIEKNKEQIPKKIFSENDKGSKISVIQSYSGYEESYVIANKIVELKMLQSDSYDNFAILYRTNAQSRILEEALRKRNIPYKIYGGLSFYQRKEIKDAISYFRLAVNPDDDEALRRVINYPARSIGEVTVNKMSITAVSNRCSIWEVINSDKLFSVGFNKNTIAKISSFRDLIQKFISMNQDDCKASEIADTIIKDTKLYACLLHDNTPENISKQENIQELLNGVNEFVSSKEEEGDENILLSNFLSEVSLATDQDSETNSNDGARVTLMTVHAAKGLEFKNVIISGVEEDLFPSAMSSDSISGIEEERRLMYVAITRAEKNCILTFASSRFHNGQTKSCVMSRFIRDIDSSYLSLSQTSSSTFEERKPEQSSRANVYVSKVPDRRSYTSISVSLNTNSANNDASFVAHDIVELSQGLKISHSRFGIGVIEKLESNGLDSKIVVNFENTGSKTLLLKFAKFKIIE